MALRSAKQATASIARNLKLHQRLTRLIGVRRSRRTRH